MIKVVCSVVHGLHLTKEIQKGVQMAGGFNQGFLEDVRSKVR